MKQFFIKLMVRFGVIMFVSVVFLRVLVSVPNEYCRQSHEIKVVRQIERMQTIKEPKIILIGGSGCGFGLCSPMISNHFEMPVCNTGTHAGMGLLIQLNLCKPYISKNDIVVIIPEYDNYLNNGYLGEVTALRILSSIYPSGYKSFSLRQQLYLIQYVPSAFRDAMKRRSVVVDEESPYSMKALNIFGDVECYENRQYLAAKDWSVKKWNQPKIQIRAIEALKKYKQFCNEQGATMLIFPAAYKAMNFDMNKVVIDEVWRALERANLPVVSCPEQYKMPDTLHYDTPYHLTYEGVIFRTNQLIKDIDSALCL